MTLLTISRCDRCTCDIEFPVDNLYTFKLDEKTEKTSNWVFLVGGPLKIEGDLCRLCTAAIVLEYNKFGSFQFSNITKQEIEEHEMSHMEKENAPVVDS